MHVTNTVAFLDIIMYILTDRRIAQVDPFHKIALPFSVYAEAVDITLLLSFDTGPTGTGSVGGLGVRPAV